MILVTVVHQDKVDYIPIIYEYREKISKHILVYDEASLDRQIAKEIEESIKNLNKKYSLKSNIEHIILDEDSKNDLSILAQKISKENGDLYLNANGCDIAIYTVLSNAVLNRDGVVIAYDSEDNSYNLISKKDIKNQKVKNNLNIEDFLLMMGDKIKEETSKEKILQKEQDIKLLFDMPSRMFKIRNLLKYNKNKLNNKQYKKELDTIQRLNTNNKDIISLFGYLFEEYIYLETRKYNFDDIKVGVKIEFDKTQVDRKNIEVTNEFDILTIKDNKIGFIECKIGSQVVPIDIVYKSDSVMDYFGHTAKSMIINLEQDKQSHLKDKIYNFKESVEFRAKQKGITIYNTFSIKKATFAKKLKEAFGVKIKPEFSKKLETESINQLKDKMEQKWI